MPRSNRKRKFIVYVATSADGFIARRDGSVDWLERPRPKGNYGMGAFYRSIDTRLVAGDTWVVFCQLKACFVLLRFLGSVRQRIADSWNGGYG